MKQDVTLGSGIHRAILDWSNDLPGWQRDALRRIIENGTLCDADIEELTTACRASNGLAEENGPELRPLVAHIFRAEPIPPPR
ncbi:hypothetical protein [Stratiformator vulcanicus]|uniref:hypothetical protein n=1 Tax=Stratiformator vulcanicus TaxID=2527980 RepID=UPI0011A848C8|nr:hypothetical protein [Stratiformator vulcanicus]